jgi:hypothetical protein
MRDKEERVPDLRLRAREKRFSADVESGGSCSRARFIASLSEQAINLHLP